MKNKKIDKYLKTSIIIVVSMISGSLLTIFLKDNVSVKKTKLVSLNSQYKAFSPLFESYDYIKDKYYKKVSTEKLVDGAIKGMLEATGDKHTNYLNSSEKESFEEELSGSYYGIGAVIQLNDDKTVSINKIFDNSPAAKSGLKVGDIFIKIDGKSVKGKDTSEVSNMLKSDKVRTSKIIIKRDNEEKEFSVTKENITLFSVSSEMKNIDNKNIGYISVSLFGEKTYSQFLDSLNKLELQNMDSLIIDLRGNSGGYLKIVAEMLSIFMDTDTTIYQIKTKTETTEYKSLFAGKKDYKIVMLVDNNSASASEIMASSMKEKYGAIIVGKTTYGKGTVQTTVDLSNNGMLKYTIQEWLTPNGNSIDKKGVTPDYDIDLDENYKNNPVVENDNQLNKAIELLR